MVQDLGMRKRGRWDFPLCRFHAGGSRPSLVTLVRESLPGNRWLQAIPDGYELSVLGLVIFGISGIGDLTWHLLLGIERSTEALLSPTHLGLALGIGLALTGPFSIRLFAFLVPLAFYSLYLVDLAIVGPIIFQLGIVWSAPFWAGTPVIAGIAGFLLSFVMLPPAQPAEDKNSQC